VDGGNSVSIVARDITEQRRAEERFYLSVEASPNGMLMADQEGKILLVNRQIEKLFGYTRGELIGRSVDMLVPAHLAQSHAREREHFMHDPKARRMGPGRDLEGVRKDGTVFPVEIGLNPIRTGNGFYVLAAVIDVTERKLAERERLLRAQVEEAARIRAELLLEMNAELEAKVEHITQSVVETAMQSLAYAYMALGDLRHRLSKSSSDATVDLEQALLQIEDHLRNIPGEIRPTVLNEFGLPHALEFLAERAGRTSGVMVDVTSSLKERLSAELELTLYRFVEEVLAGTGKNGAASPAQVHLRLDRGVVHCQIVQGRAAPASPSNVLLGIKEKIALMGGTVEVTSSAAGRREIRAAIPLGNLNEVGRT
jgi:PAS domain S-box-containing protein